MDDRQGCRLNFVEYGGPLRKRPKRRNGKAPHTLPQGPACRCRQITWSTEQLGENDGDVGHGTGPVCDDTIRRAQRL